MTQEEQPYEPVGLHFWDAASNRKMVYITEGKQYVGWIVYKHPDGQWVTLRKATQSDILELSKALSSAPVRLPWSENPRKREICE